MTNGIKSWVPDVWTTVPWLTSHRIDSAGQAQHPSAHTSPSEQKAEQEAKPQGAALD